MVPRSPTIPHASLPCTLTVPSTLVRELSSTSVYTSSTQTALLTFLVQESTRDNTQLSHRLCSTHELGQLTPTKYQRPPSHPNVFPSPCKKNPRDSSRETLQQRRSTLRDISWCLQKFPSLHLRLFLKTLQRKHIKIQEEPFQSYPMS